MSAIMSRVLLNSRFQDKEVQDGKLVYNFDKNQHAQVLLRNLIAMQDNDEGSLTDVIMTSNDNEQFHFHGPILAALSKKMEEILLEKGLGSTTSRHSKIVIKEEFSSEAVQCLWDYAYTSAITITPSNIHEVKELAEHHGLDNLKKECELIKQEGFGDDSDCAKLDFKNLPASISKRLHRLLEDGKLCSAVITGTDSLAKIPYHGAVVTATCSDFSELGHGDSNKNLKVDNATFQAMDHFLKYLYTGCLEVEPARVQTLLQMAVTLNLPGMGHACCCWLEDALTAENALGIMEITQAGKTKAKEGSSETNGKDSVSLFKALDELYQTARAFALRDFLNVQDNDEYLEMRYEELIELIVDDDLVVNTEDSVFHAVMKWVEFDPEIRAEDLPNLLQSVRLEHLSIEFLDTIMEHDLVKANSLCVEVIQKASKDLQEKDQQLFSPSNYDPTYGSQCPPDQSLPELDALFELLDPPSDGPSLQESNVPSHPDMRLRRNREAFLEKGKNVDGTPDKRRQDNKAISSVARKLTYPVGDIPRTKNGKPDMRFKVNKMELSKQKGQNSTLTLLPQGPNRKDGQPDMRFKANRSPKQGVLRTGPTRTDGQPDMRYAANKQKIDIEYQTPHREAPTAGPKKKDGTRDMRFAVNKKAEASLTSSVPPKNDGTPDRRHRGGDSGNYHPSAASGPLKKDGTLDMRYACNKSSSSPGIGSGYPSLGGSTTSVSSSSSGSYGYPTARGPLKTDGTPDMRYSSNKSSSSSSFGSGSSSSSGRSTSSFSSGYSGSSSFSASSGPLKSNGTPDMRYSANRH